MAQTAAPVKNVWFSKKPTAVTNSSQASIQEPTPTSPRSMPVWKALDMTEDQFKAFEERMRVANEERRRVAIQRYLADEWQSLAFWERRIETLEMLRSRYNKKAAWSAEIIRTVENIDAQIAECMERIDELWDNADKYEDAADW